MLAFTARPEPNASPSFHGTATSWRFDVLSSRNRRGGVVGGGVGRGEVGLAPNDGGIRMPEGLVCRYAGLLASRKDAGQSQSDGSRDARGSGERGRQSNGLEFQVVAVLPLKRASSER